MVNFEDEQNQVTDPKEYFLTKRVPGHIIDVVLKAISDYGQHGTSAMITEIMIRIANWAFTKVRRFFDCNYNFNFRMKSL